MSVKPNLFHADRDGWQRHSTRTRPVSSETIVEPWFAFGRGRYTYEAGKLNWAGHNDQTRIIGYRVVEVSQ